jgi:phospholipase C
VQGYWNYAQHFALNDNFYGTTYGPTTLGHVNLISGNTHGVVGTTQTGVTVYALNTTTGAGIAEVVTVAGSNTDPISTAGAGTPAGGGTEVGDLRPLGDDCASGSASTSVWGTYGSSGRNVGDLLNSAGVSWGWFGGGFRPTVPYTASVQPPASAANAAVPGNAAVCASLHEAADGTVKVDYAGTQEPFQLYTSTQNLHHLAPASPAEIGHAGIANHQYDVMDLFSVNSISGATSQTYTITGLAPGVVLPAVTFIKPPTSMTGHAQYSNPLLEQQFVTQIINALMQSSYWPNMAIIIAYDDSDGWYDHVTPPLVNPSQTATGAATESSDGLTGNSSVTVSGATITEVPSGTCGVAASGAVMGRCGYGPRLPFLLISPFSKINFVDHTLIDQSAILRFIEDNWSLGRINSTPTPISQGGSFDQVAGSLLNMFNFTTRHSLQAPGLQLNPVTGVVVAGANDE